MSLIEMSFKKIIDDLDSYFKSMKQKQLALQRLFDKGIISQNTFDLTDKKINLLVSKCSQFKEVLINEDSSWKTNLLEERRILENLLFGIEYKHLLGEINEEEWNRESKIFDIALDLTKNNLSLLSSRNNNKSTLFTKTASQKNIEKLKDKLTKEDEPNSTKETKKLKRIIKKPLGINNSTVSKGQCMNPWNTECRNKDINLSIYYKGKMTPICRECWEDISKGNIEW
jgi:hypothetical protein